MEYTQQEFISMMQQKRWMCDVAEAKVKEAHFDLIQPISIKEKTIWQPQAWQGMFFVCVCFFVAYLNDYLLKQFVVDVKKKKTHHRRLRPRIYRGKEFIHSLRYPFIKLSQAE